MGETRNVYRILVAIPSGKQRRRWEDDIKMDFGENILRI